MTQADIQSFANVFVECLRRFHAEAGATPAFIDPAKAAAAVASALRQQQPGPRFPALDQISTEFLTTEAAAHHLGRQPQTLRWWHSQGCGPVKPVRRGGRLAWPVEEIRAFLRGEGDAK